MGTLVREDTTFGLSRKDSVAREVVETPALLSPSKRNKLSMKRKSSSN